MAEWHRGKWCLKRLSGIPAALPDVRKAYPSNWGSVWMDILSPPLVGITMDSLNSNSLIKIEPSTGFDRVNDGGFEALLDEFGPDTYDDYRSHIKTDFSEDVPVPGYSNNQKHNFQEPTPVPPPLLMPPLPPPPLPSAELIANVEFPNSNLPNTTSETDNQTIDSNRQANQHLDVNPECRRIKLDVKKKRRRVRRTLARAAALVCANGDLDKLTVPVNKESVTKLPISPDGNFEVAVFPTNYPATEITEEQFGIIQEKFVKAMTDDTMLHVQFFCPRFLDCYLKNGFVYFVCADVTSRHWVIATLPKLNFWPNAKLIAIDAPNLLSLTRVIAWTKPIPINNNKILSLLEKQNDRIKTSKWVIHDRAEPTDKGVRIIFGIDEDSIEILRGSGGKLFLGLGRIEFVLPEDKNTKATNQLDAGQERTTAMTTATTTVPATTSSNSAGANALNIRRMNTPASNSNVKTTSKPVAPLLPRLMNFNFNNRINPISKFPSTSNSNFSRSNMLF